MQKKTKAVDPAIAMPVEYVSRPCGPKDREARFPEPAHYDCAGCRKVISAFLLDRQAGLIQKPDGAL